MSLINKQNLAALEKICGSIANYISACECNGLENHIQIVGIETPENTYISNLIFSNILSKLDSKVLEDKLSDGGFETEEVDLFVEDMIEGTQTFFIPECNLQEQLNNFKKTLTENQFYCLFERELDKIINDYEMLEDESVFTIFENCDHKLLKKLLEDNIGEAFWETSDYWSPNSLACDLSGLLEKKELEATNKSKTKTI